MPKHECDPEDPMALVGVSLACPEDTLVPMAECFIEEFMWLRFSPWQILALFDNPAYAGPHRVYRERGEAFVRQLIADTFAKWSQPAPNHESLTTDHE